jgi:cholesterol transport system auxiliary component
MRAPRNRLALIAALALPLGGCVSFGAKPPPTLMTLTADAGLAAGTVRSAQDGGPIAILTPTVPATLATLRLPVQDGPVAVAYLKDAQWTEPPSRLFRALLAETIAAKTGRIVAERGQAGPTPGLTLGGRISAFGLNAAAGEVVVRYDATLMRDGALTTRRFEAKAPAVAKPGPVASALNRAANQVAGEVADWVGR